MTTATTATTELFATRAMHAVTATSPLLSILSLILGVSLRESLATESASQDEAGFIWGL